MHRHPGDERRLPPFNFFPGDVGDKQLCGHVHYTNLPQHPPHGANHEMLAAYQLVENSRRAFDKCAVPFNRMLIHQTYLLEGETPPRALDALKQEYRQFDQLVGHALFRTDGRGMPKCTLLEVTAGSFLFPEELLTKNYAFVLVCSSNGNYKVWRAACLATAYAYHASWTNQIETADNLLFFFFDTASAAAAMRSTASASSLSPEFNNPFFTPDASPVPAAAPRLPTPPPAVTAHSPVTRSGTPPSLSLTHAQWAGLTHSPTSPLPTVVSPPPARGPSRTQQLLAALNPFGRTKGHVSLTSPVSPVSPPTTGLRPFAHVFEHEEEDFMHGPGQRGTGLSSEAQDALAHLADTQGQLGAKLAEQKAAKRERLANRAMRQKGGRGGAAARPTISEPMPIGLPTCEECHNVIDMNFFQDAAFAPRFDGRNMLTTKIYANVASLFPILSDPSFVGNTTPFNELLRQRPTYWDGRPAAAEAQPYVDNIVVHSFAPTVSTRSQLRAEIEGQIHGIYADDFIIAQVHGRTEWWCTHCFMSSDRGQDNAIRYTRAVRIFYGAQGAEMAALEDELDDSQAHPTPAGRARTPTPPLQQPITFTRHPYFAAYVGPLLVGQLVAHPHMPHTVTFEQAPAAGQHQCISFEMIPAKTATWQALLSSTNPNSRLIDLGNNKTGFALNYRLGEGSFAEQYSAVTLVAAYTRGRPTLLAALNFNSAIACVPPYINNVLLYDRELMPWITQNPRVNTLWCLDWDSTLTRKDFHVSLLFQKGCYDTVLADPMRRKAELPFSIEQFMKEGVAEDILRMLSEQENNVIAIVTFHWDVELIRYILTTFLHRKGKPELAQRIFIRVLPLSHTISPRSQRPATYDPPPVYGHKNVPVRNVLESLYQLGITAVDDVILIDDSKSNITDFKDDIRGYTTPRQPQDLPPITRFGYLRANADNDVFSMTGITEVAAAASDA